LDFAVLCLLLSSLFGVGIHFFWFSLEMDDKTGEIHGSPCQIALVQQYLFAHPRHASKPAACVGKHPHPHGRQIGASQEIGQHGDAAP
jgi:hypothetical protein